MTTRSPNGGSRETQNPCERHHLHSNIILYQGNSITIYYDKNSWNFTRLARIDNMNKKRLQQILGKGNVKTTFSVE